VVCLIVGLGNPGISYQKTRHNLGFRIVDALAGYEGKKALFQRTSKCLVVQKDLAGIKAILAKPRTYVNRSGEAVLDLLNRYHLPKEVLLVVCDDLALPLGTIRLRRKGSSGGHNGLQSIIETIGSDFARLRIGIGAPDTSAQWADYVLEPFTPEEERLLPEIIKRAVAEILNFAREIASL